MLRSQALLQAAKDSGFENAGLLETSCILFHEDIRKACERNVCGKYDTNWMGPPAIGSISDLKARVLRFRKGLLVQSIHQLASSFDWNGMMAAAKEHQALFRRFLADVGHRYPAEDFLPLDAGCCAYCEKCSYQDSRPCAYPEQALSSVEAYGMDVATLLKAAGLPYNHGRHAVGFVGLILFDLQVMSQ